MKEEIYEGYDFLVMLIKKYREDSEKQFSVMAQNNNDLKVIEFGLKLDWLQHKRGQFHVLRPKFVWTEKAKKYIEHLDEWE
jgi:hypothetical protein